MGKINSANRKLGVVLVSPFSPVVPISKICLRGKNSRRGKNKKNPATSLHRRCGFQEVYHV